MLIMLIMAGLGGGGGGGGWRAFCSPADRGEQRRQG